jgi:hypothetical protein
MQSEPAIWGGLGIIFLLAIFLIGLLLTVFWIWMLVDSLTNKGLSDTEKLVFVLLVVFLPFIGSLIYFFVGRPKRRLTAP